MLVRAAVTCLGELCRSHEFKTEQADVTLVPNCYQCQFKEWFDLILFKTFLQFKHRVLPHFVLAIMLVNVREMT